MAGSRYVQNEDVKALSGLNQQARSDYFNALAENKRTAIIESIFSSSDPTAVIKEFQSFVNLFNNSDKDTLEKIMYLTDPFITQLVQRVSFTRLSQWSEENIKNAFVATMNEMSSLTFKVIIDSSPFVKLSRSLKEKPPEEIANFIINKSAVIREEEPDDFVQFYRNFSLAQQNIILKSAVDNKLHHIFPQISAVYTTLLRQQEIGPGHDTLKAALYDLFIEAQKNIPDKNKNVRQQLALIRKLPYWPLPADREKFRQALSLALPKAGAPLAEAIIKQEHFQNDVFRNEGTLHDCIQRYIKDLNANIKNASHDELIKTYQQIEGFSYLLAMNGKKDDKDDVVFNDPNSKSYKQLQTMLQTEAKSVLTELVSKSQNEEQVENAAQLLSNTKASPLMVKPKQSVLTLGFLKADKTLDFPQTVQKLHQDVSLRLMNVGHSGPK